VNPSVPFANLATPCFWGSSLSARNASFFENDIFFAFTSYRKRVRNFEETPAKAREAARDFSTGDRVRLTAPYREERVANRQLGTVQQIDTEGNLHVRLDSGQDVQFNIRQHPHVDYGYAVTSHSSQGATADRVLVHVDTEQGRDELINSRLAYVSVSRGRYDAQIYTNDAGRLGEHLGRDVSKPSALETVEDRGQGQAAGDSMHHAVSESQGHGKGHGTGH